MADNQQRNPNQGTQSGNQNQNQGNRRNQNQGGQQGQRNTNDRDRTRGMDDESSGLGS